MRERFWSDDFDMDLLKLFPDLPERLGPAANIPMWTHGGTSHGRLNHPSVWNGYAGMVAFFGLVPGQTGKPDEYYTSDPVVECTWLEALRDTWPHSLAIVVDGYVVWNTGGMWPTFSKIMYDVRGSTKLPEGQADKLRGQVLASVLAATRDLASIVEAVKANG